MYGYSRFFIADRILYCLQTILGAGHFVFADKAELINRLVQHTCSLVDHRLDVVLPRTKSTGRLRRVRSECGPNLVKMSGMQRRRCDSQCISEEPESYMPSAAVAAAAAVRESSPEPQPSELEEPPRPVFVVSDDDY
jgi:hypothetical protein